MKYHLINVEKIIFKPRPSWLILLRLSFNIHKCRELDKGILPLDIGLCVCYLLNMSPKRRRGACAIAFLALLAGMIVQAPGLSIGGDSKGPSNPECAVIIDPGHGGNDLGAVVRSEERRVGKECRL